MILNVVMGIEIVVFLISLFCEMCTMSTVVISEEDE